VAVIGAVKGTFAAKKRGLFSILPSPTVVPVDSSIALAIF
jgi:hypothetical protein